MKLAIVLVALVIGSLIFHFMSPWWFTPIASNWHNIDLTINITFWVTGIVFVAVNLFLAYVVYRYRYDKNKRSLYQPENKKLEGWLTVITALGVAAMLAPGLIVWGDFVTVPDNADEIEVVGQQWQWGYRFPGGDKQLGKTAARFISEENPFGLDPTDEAGQDDIIVDSNEIHLPINRPVKVLLRSKDVLHNFAVPQFRVKMDLVPGTVSYLWFEPTRVGKFDILCMELCGIAHHAMRGKVIVDSEQDFNDWLNLQPTFAQTQHGAKGDPIAGQALYAVCSSCHGQQGEGNVALHAPNLNGQFSWYLTRQLQYYKQGVRGTHKDDSFGQQMAAMAAVLQDDKAIKDVVAYINTFPKQEHVATIEGNPEKGRSLYVTCGACHGKKGEGKFSLNAPRLAGVQDWYIKQQLNNFKLGYRGSHEQDNYGAQMILMAKMLSSEKAMDDLVSYLNTL
ncbi:c-type cytochrome [Agarilytica rhodophyticola]|uniref:c-type cytochrome n=1 Tax=Agarilytica rhodophyticola TaxID=1737490 RepID=UPI000B343CC1|nr:c-type cytochrome [Agarilytica rhodophyticola]